MPLVREFVGLAGRTVALWARYLPALVTWLTAGWLVNQMCLAGSTMMGAQHRLLALLIFVLGVCGRVMGIIFAIESLKPGLTVVAQLQTPGSMQRFVPEEALTRERRVEVALLTIGPFMAIYSVWGEVDKMIADGFRWNAALRQWDSESWTMTFNLEQFPVYLGIAVGALVARIVWGRLVGPGRPPWLRLPILFFEGAWAFSMFFVAYLGIQEAMDWLYTRAGWRKTETAWHQWLAQLPEIQLPFDFTLPEFIDATWTWTWESLVPAIWVGLALPLVWLALAGVIFGWRDLSLHALIGREAHADGWSASHPRLRSAMDFATGDLRDKYLPLLHALRMTWRSGPYVLGSYLILAALLDVMNYWLNVAFTQIFAVGGQQEMLASFTATGGIRWLVMTSLALALYAATFDRGLRDTLSGHTLPEGELSDVSPTAPTDRIPPPSELPPEAPNSIPRRSGSSPAT